MPDSIGINLIGGTIFYKQLIPTDPANAPILRTLVLPDLTVITPGTLLSSHPSAGVYGGILVTASQNTQYGGYLAELFTADLLMDSQVAWVQFEVRADPIAAIVPGAYPVNSVGYDIALLLARTAAGVNVSDTSPFTTEFDFDIEQGDAYIAGTSQEIAWAGNAFWPVLGIASVNLIASRQPGWANPVIFPATYDAVNNRVVLNSLLAADTNGLKLSIYAYKLNATLTVSANGPVTLKTGLMNVKRSA